jgi:hypothetical protein
MLRLSSNALALRKAVDARAALPAIETQDPPMDWLIWRKDFGAHFRSLEPRERWALGAAQRGESFPALCEGVCAFVPSEDALAMGGSADRSGGAGGPRVRLKAHVHGRLRPLPGAAAFFYAGQ